MDLSDMRINMNPQEIRYATASFKRIVAREVYQGNKPTGTYHIKPIEKININFLVNFLKERIRNAEVDLTDPSGEMKLEYPIYIIFRDGITRADMILDIQDVDSNLDEYLKNRKK